MQNDWSFDIWSALMALGALPITVALGRLISAHIRDWLVFGVDGIMYWTGRLLKHAIAAELSLRHFASHQLKGNNRLLPVPSRTEVTLDTDTVFVTLRLEHGGPSQSTYTHRNLLSLGNRIRVVGDPGSGKSSIVKKMFRDECRLAESDPKKARLPVIVELRDIRIPDEILDEQLGDWFLSEIRGRVSGVEIYRMGECFDVYASTTGVLVFLDGLDEVASVQYPRVAQSILQLSQILKQRNANSVLVLTMRTHFHQQIRADFTIEFPHIASILPFSPTDIFEFLTRWPFGTSRSSSIARIYRDLMDRPTLREMCGNPLVLAMYVAEDQASAEPIVPETRTEFYSTVADELIIKRRYRQVGAPIGRAALQEQRERILGAIAFDHLLNPEQPANSLDWQEGVSTVARVLSLAPDDAERELRDIGKETGIITEEQTGERFRFIHLTFCEFFAALEATQGRHDGWERLIRAHASFHASDDRWLQARLVEVLPFACGLLPRVRREAALTDIQGIRDPHLVARAYLETKLYSHPGWKAFVEAEYKRLTQTAPKHWDEQWLRDFHVFNVVLRDAKECARYLHVEPSVIGIEDFFKNLTRKQRGSLERLLSALASHDAGAAWRIAETTGVNMIRDFPDVIIRHCDQAPFLALLLDHAFSDGNDAGKWAAVLAEAGLRSHLVRTLMESMEEPGSWTNQVNAVPASQHWSHPRIAERSLYTSVLTIATSRPIAEHRRGSHRVEVRSLKKSHSEGNSVAFRYTEVLRSVPAPGAYGRRMHLLFATFLLSASLSAGILVILGLSESTIYQPALLAPEPWVFAVVVAVMGLGLVSFATLESYRNAYRLLMSPRPSLSPSGYIEYLRLQKIITQTFVFADSSESLPNLDWPDDDDEKSSHGLIVERFSRSKIDLLARKSSPIPLLAGSQWLWLTPISVRSALRRMHALSLERQLGSSSPYW